jgi:hypothetical protein
MQIRVTIRNGSALVETVSVLEDLWHDFVYFKERAGHLNRPKASVSDRLRAKRYQRSAIVMLAFYFEGVVNRWLHLRLPPVDFIAIERKPLDVKIERLIALAGAGRKLNLKADAAKRLRNVLAHLKPGHDLALFDEVTTATVLSSESTLVGWLQEMEQVLGQSRHPHSEAESRSLRSALGHSVRDAEGDGGTRPRRRKNG